MEIIDISWPITPDITEYKNKKTVQITHVKQFSKDHVREATITLGTHTGTHVDAPAHFLEEGKTLDQIPLQNLIGPCCVLNMMHIEDHVTADDLKSCDIKKDDIVLLKTKNSFKSSTDEFDSNFIYLEASGAKYLASLSVHAVGIDYLGIERNQPDHETHQALLTKNILIIEGLRLQHVNKERYFFCCLPLAFKGLEAIPARAVLLKDSFSV